MVGTLLKALNEDCACYLESIHDEMKSGFIDHQIIQEKKGWIIRYIDYLLTQDPLDRDIAGKLVGKRFVYDHSEKLTLLKNELERRSFWKRLS